MNEYIYDDIKVGQSESFSVEISEEMQDSFLKITGDVNPMHSDGEYAVSKGFDGKLVFGMLTASFLSTLAGVYLPGKHCLFHEIAGMRFIKPVYIHDRLTISGEVTEKNDLFNQITIKVKIRNQNGVLVSSAKVKAGVLNE